MATGTTGTTGTTGSRTDMSIFSFPPIFMVIVGVLVLAFFIAGNVMQIQSSEAWMIGEHPELWKLNFHIFEQWGQFFNGGFTARQYVAFIAAWGVQFVQLVMKVGLGFTQAYAVSKHATEHHMHENNMKEARLRVVTWNIVSWATVVWNSITDWQYSDGMGFGQQILFCLIAFVTTFYLGTWGVLMIAGGIDRMRKN